jgi:hypothetical protein
VDGGYERNLRVPFTTDPARIEQAVEALAVTWRRIRAGATPVMLDRMDAVV